MRNMIIMSFGTHTHAHRAVRTAGTDTRAIWARFDRVTLRSFMWWSLSLSPVRRRRHRLRLRRFRYSVSYRPSVSPSSIVFLCCIAHTFEQNSLDPLTAARCGVDFNVSVRANQPQPPRAETIGIWTRARARVVRQCGFAPRARACVRCAHISAYVCEHGRRATGIVDRLSGATRTQHRTGVSVRRARVRARARVATLSVVNVVVVV